MDLLMILTNVFKNFICAMGLIWIVSRMIRIVSRIINKLINPQDRNITEGLE